MNADGTYETGYAWFYGGIAPPDWGAFAECYRGQVAVCGVVLDLTGLIGTMDCSVDVFLWDDRDGQPGNVLCVLHDPQIYPVAFWPAVSRSFVEFPSPCCTGEAWWVGFWPNWPGGWCDLYVAADLDGPGGCPMTKIAPGQGYPTGWQDVSLVWGPTQAMGIGAETVPCPPVPTKTTTWGTVKSLYRHATR